ncbi:replication factor C small subunit [Candidatus Micrarchaeota archaeon]|nr:replication factor C small subunit [Candidatus Micrarchaeota archaeon]
MDFDLPWTEKYRPKNLEEVIGHKEIAERLKAFVKSKNVPNMMFAGPAGIGKTSATLALARELFGDAYSESLLELNSSDERGIDIVRGKIKDFARVLPLADVPFKIIFLDESDALTPDAQHALRRTMEVYAGATRFILSCNFSSKIIEPIQSRCVVFRFKPLSENDIREMLVKISNNEGIKISEDGIKAIIYISDGDMRKAINALQGASTLSKSISEETIYKVSSRARPQEIKEMMEFALKGSFVEARNKLDYVLLNYGMSGEDVLLQVYREVASLDVPDRAKVQLVDRIGEYNFRMVEGANERIQLEAMLAQIMLIGQNAHESKK